MKIAPRVNVFYGDKQALFDVSMDIPDRAVTVFHRPVGLRQDHVPALLQPYERFDRIAASPAHFRSSKDAYAKGR